MPTAGARRRATPPRSTALREPLALSFDDFIRTSRDPRHRAGVERLWRACADAGDLYRKHYEGLYCVGCEQFYAPAELVDGRCPEHGTEPQLVAEENWFFRLSRYAGPAARPDQQRPAADRAGARGATRCSRSSPAGLEDFSISRSQTRARGWGIPVPDDPDQVIYVWWDALGNYITALDYGSDGADYQRWWVGSDRRVHLLGKGVLRFHAVYWPAMLLSAGLPLPTDLLVHDYLTVDGHKISKSGGHHRRPGRPGRTVRHRRGALVAAARGARVGDADFTVERLVARANGDLANGLGNLVNRVVSMVHRYRRRASYRPPAADPAARRPTVCCPRVDRRRR